MPDQPTVPASPGSSAEYRPGAVLDGRYELVGVLGRGGMATVWRAHDKVLARDVAVKVFTAVSSHPDPAAAARATAEVRILAGLSHPNVVAVFDASGAGSAADGQFDHLVMELVDGRSLRDRLDEGPLAPADTAQLGAELAAGLEYVHERGVVHRDLKPANVLLERTRRGDRAKLADFGVARLVEGAPLTMIGTTVGTANYLSPEQATGHEVGPPSDVYSLGLVLLECLTGVLAYPGQGVAAASARLHRPPFHPADIEPRWRELLHAMTALDPAARPDTADVAARLAVLASAPEAGTATLPAAARDTAVLPAPAPGRRRRRGVAVLGAVGLVLALVVGFLLATGGGGDTGPPASPGSTAPSTSAVPSPRPTTSSATTSRAVVPPSVSRTTTTTANASTGPVQPPGQQKKDGKSKPGKPDKPGKP